MNVKSYTFTQTMLLCKSHVIKSGVGHGRFNPWENELTPSIVPLDLASLFNCFIYQRIECQVKYINEIVDIR